MWKLKLVRAMIRDENPDGNDGMILEYDTMDDIDKITKEYIEREYTIAGNHLMLTSEHTAREIEQKESIAT